MHAATLTPHVARAPHSAVVPAVRRRTLPGLTRLRTIVRQSRRHGIWIVAWSLIGWIGTALAPMLSDEPFLLMLLSPRALFVALASGSAPLVPFVVLGTLRLSATDASYYIIGRRLPDAKAASAPGALTGWRGRLRSVATRGDRLCRWFCDRPRLAGAFLFFRPNGKYLGLAGAYGVNSWVAGLSATVGTATFLTAMHIGLGAAL